MLQHWAIITLNNRYICAGIFEITIGKSYYSNWPKDMLNTKSSMMKDRNRNTTFTNYPILCAKVRYILRK